MKYFFLLIFLLPIESTLGYTFISPTQTLTKSGTEIKLHSKYFKSQSYVNELGEGFSFNGNDSYEQMDMAVEVRHGLTSQFEAMAGIRGRYITSLVTVNNEEHALSRTGVDSGVVGFKYSFKEEDGIQYAMEGSYRQSFFSNSEYTGGEPIEIALGDDSREITAGFSVNLKTDSSNHLSTIVLYRDPSKYLSTEIFSQIEFNLVWKYLSLGIGVENVYSLETDEYSNDQQNKPQVSTGPSYYFNSINRQWTAPFFKSSLAIGKSWRGEFQFTSVRTGNSTDIRDELLFSLIKRTDKKIDSYKVVDNSFKQYTVDGVVSKVATSRKTVMIDRGLERGVKKGMRVDFFDFNYVGGNTLIATGSVVRVGASKALVMISKRYSKKRVEVGTVARTGLLTD